MYENVGLLLQKLQVQKFIVERNLSLIKKKINQEIINHFKLNPYKIKK